MKNMLSVPKSAAIALVIGVFYASPSYAYLDAGSVSLLLQGIIAAVAGGTAAVGLYWRQVKNFVRGRREEASGTPAVTRDASRDE